jgi:hypothetical protein
MKCAIHPGRDAISSCVNCGNLVCPECKASLGNQIYCNPCIEARLKTGSWPLKPVATVTNTSGISSITEIPVEIRGWNWGGFFLTWIWGIGNNVWIAMLALLGLIPYIGWIAHLTVAIILGMKGNEWAWRNKRWESLGHFRKTQRSWMWWGLGILIFQIVFFILIVALLIGMFIMLGFLSINNGEWNWNYQSPWQ